MPLPVASRLAPVLAALALLAPAQSCVSGGPLLDVEGGRIGDPFAISLTAAPGAPGLLGVSTASGTLPTPYGPACLGGAGAPAILPLLTDATGAWSLQGTLPVAPNLIGTSLFGQALVLDASYAGGGALSNDAPFAIRTPHLLLISDGVPGLGAGFAGRIEIVDALNFGPVATQQMTAAIRDHAEATDRGVIYVALTDGTVRGYSMIDLQPRGVANLPGAAPAWQIILSEDGQHLIAHVPGFPANVITLELPSMNIVSQTTVPQTVTNSPMFLSPGSSRVWIRTGGASLHRVDYLSGLVEPPVALGGVGGVLRDLLQAGDDLFATIVGQGQITLVRMDAATGNIPWWGTTVLSAPAGLGGGWLAIGPGDSGPDVLMVATFGSILEIDRSTLIEVATHVTPNSMREMVPTPAGDAWIMFDTFYTGPIPPPESVYRMTPDGVITDTFPGPLNCRELVAMPSGVQDRMFFLADLFSLGAARAVWFVDTGPIAAPDVAVGAGLLGGPDHLVTY